MKKLVFVSAMLICTASAMLAQAPKLKRAFPQKAEASALRPFVGTWRLVSSLETLKDGTVRPYGFGPHATGYLMYDATGHMCAQVVNPDRPKWKDPEHPTPQEIKAAYDGFGGYCGTYTVDEKGSKAAHLPEVPFDPNLVGQAKPRSYRFEGGDKLIYSGAEQSEEGETRWEMVWERVK